MKRPAVFLDRDGVLNRAIVHNGTPHPPSGVHELEILPGVVQACTALRKAGFILVVLSNQPDVARGKQKRDVVEALNSALRKQIPLDDVRVCYHDDSDGCLCRKPRPGLALQAAADWQIDLGRSYFIGDRWRDTECGRSAGCTTILIDYGYSEESRCVPDRSVGSLAEAAEWILDQRTGL